MAKSLPPFKEMLSRGWNDYLTHWSPTIQMTLWLLTVPILQLGIMVVFNPSTIEAGQLVIRLMTILQVIVSLWIMVRVMRWYLSEFKNDPSYDHDGISSLKAVPSLLFASILKSLAVMGGVMLLFFPGLWLAVLLGFTELLVLEDGLKGVQALRTSANLVKGRWWNVFARLMGISFLFLLMGVVIYVMLQLIIGSISGLNITEAMALNLNPANLRTILIAFSTDQVVSSIVQALLLPLFFAWQIRLFHELKQTA